MSSGSTRCVKCGSLLSERSLLSTGFFKRAVICEACSTVYLVRFKILLHPFFLIHSSLIITVAGLRFIIIERETSNYIFYIILLVFAILIKFFLKNVSLKKMINSVEEISDLSGFIDQLKGYKFFLNSFCLALSLMLGLTLPLIYQSMKGVNDLINIILISVIVSLFISVVTAPFYFTEIKNLKNILSKNIQKK